jgi:tetratricopeptide (TPR) repeat protein
MLARLPQTVLKFLVALLKHQAEAWLGEEAAGIAARTLIEEELQKRLESWLNGEQTVRELLRAAQEAQRYLQDERNCPDRDLRLLFRDVNFGDLPSVQDALRELPRAMDAQAVTEALRRAFARDFPHLTPEQQAEGARLWTEALLRAVGRLRDFTLPILLQTVQDLRCAQREQIAHLQRILQHLEQGRPPASEDAARLGEAIRRGHVHVEVEGSMQGSVLLIGSGNVVHLTPVQTVLLRRSVTLPGDLPPGSYLPLLPNKLFTGRQAQLEALARALLTEDEGAVIPPHALFGMGGVGKTQLAVQFAWQHGYRFVGVHWVSAYSREGGEKGVDEAIRLSIAQCGRAMNLPNWVEGKGLLDRQVEITLAAWKESGPRLVLLDNLEDPKVADYWLARLRHRHIRVLITTRRSDWPPAFGLSLIPLEVFTPEESRAFLRRYLDEGRAGDEELRALHERLGGLPLALDLAASYLQHVKGLRVAEYLKRLSLEHPSLRGWRAKYPNATRHDKDVAATFALSWERVESEAARRLFVLAGYAPPDEPLPREVLREAAGLDEAAFSEALDLLQGLSLLPPEGGMHPLLAEFARLQDVDRSALFRWAGALARRGYPGHERGGIYRDPGLARLVRLSLPDLLRAAALPEREEDRSLLCFHTAFFCAHFGDPDGAMRLYQEALEIAERLGDLRGKGDTLYEMAYILRLRGDLDGAMRLYQEALEIFERLGDLRGKGDTLYEMAYILRLRGDLDGAMRLYQEALEIFERLGDLRGKGDTLYEMAYILRLRGDLDGAMRLYQEALEIAERLGDLRGKGDTLYEMAYILRLRGDLDGAMRLYQEALEIAERLGDLRGKGDTLYEMAYILRLRGDLDGAMRLYQEALELFERLGDLLWKGATLREMAYILRLRGDLDGAMRLYQQSLEIKERLGDLRGKGATLHEMASIYVLRGDLDGAMRLYQEALEIAERLGDLQGKGATLHEMASIYVLRGDLDGAMRLYQEALELFERLGDLLWKGATLREMAYILRLRGDLDGAMRLYQQSLEIKERLGDLRGKGATLHEMASIYVLRGDLDGAMRLYQEALEIAERLGDLQGKGATLHEMASIYVLRGDLDGAMRLYQEALELFERLGDLRDKAVTLGMMGQALWAQGKRGEAIASLWSGLELLMRLGIEPQTWQAMASDLARWRGELGAEAFDRLWRQVTGQPVPDWLARP